MVSLTSDGCSPSKEENRKRNCMARKKPFARCATEFACKLMGAQVGIESVATLTKIVNKAIPLTAANREWFNEALIGISRIA